MGMPSCVTWQCGDIVLYVVSGMTFPSAPVSSLQMSWFVYCGDRNFSCTSACVPSVLPAVPSVFQAGRNIIHPGCQRPSRFREHVCLVPLSLLVELAVLFWRLWHRPCTSLSSSLPFHIRDKYIHRPDSLRRHLCTTFHIVYHNDDIDHCHIVVAYYCIFDFA